MKSLLEALVIAFSMYSAIPMPQIQWNKRNIACAIAFLPAVGLVSAAGIWGLYEFCRLLSLAPALFSALAVMLSILITGGIHLDGFCDTCDALASHSSREKHLAILKDPHVGAFAVIYTCALILLQFGAWYQLYLAPGYLAAAFSAFIISRVLASLAVLKIKKASEQGLAATFSQSSKGLVLPLIAIAALTVTAAVLYSGWPALLAALGALLFFMVFKRMAIKQFGGITGDLAGFLLVGSETLMLLTAALLGAV